VQEAFERGFVLQNKGQDRLDFEAAAAALDKTGDHLRARRFHERCIALDARDPSLHDRAAASCLAGGDLEGALRHYAAGAAVDRSGAHDFELRMGEACLFAGDAERARGHVEASLRAGETPPRCVALGDLLRALGDLEGAFRAFRRATALASELEEPCSIAEERIEQLKAEWCEAELRDTVARWWEAKERALLG
jgi:tetratricopeptide (TPR) repeat protein